MADLDERLLEAHLAPIREDVRDIKAMLTASAERGVQMREDVATMKVEIAFLKRVVFGTAGVAGGAAVAVILKYLGI